MLLAAAGHGPEVACSDAPRRAQYELNEDHTTAHLCLLSFHSPCWLLKRVPATRTLALAWLLSFYYRNINDAFFFFLSGHAYVKPTLTSCLFIL